MTAALIDELRWRGLVHQITDEAIARSALDDGAAVYIGFDPTADSLHVGSLLQLVLLMHAQRHGNLPIAVLGGGTGMIGDPSGKSKERNLLGEADLQRNSDGLRRQFERFLNFEGETAARMINNLDWLGPQPLITFLRDVGKHFSVNAMVQRDSVRTRIEGREAGISFTEFSYMLLQAFDFLVLWRDHGCRGQMGGSDQWGNIVSGIDLIRREISRSTEAGDDSAAAKGGAFGITSPLITKRDGSKFGKTEEGNVWLDAEKTSPFRFYQFWINADDADVGDYLRYFTFLSRTAIDGILGEHAQSPHRRVAQRRLANEVTAMVHGDDGLALAQRATEVLFGGDLEGLSAAMLEEIFDSVPSSVLPAMDDGGWPVRSFLVGDGRPFASNGEAKKALRAGAVRVNNKRLAPDFGALVTPDSLIDGRLAVVRHGRKRTFLVRADK